MIVVAAVALLAAFAAPAGGPADGETFLREEFASLDAWRPLTFPKIERHSTYTVVAGPGDAESSLRAESDRSASAIVWKRQYDVYEHPRLRWRWQVEKVYEKGDATNKEGDDYPLRIYVMFAYDAASASMGKRLKYGLAKLVYGEYPPDSGLNYVWESRENAAEYVVSPYTDSVMLYLKEKGAARAGQWITEEADVLADYRRAFGKNPPRSASLGVMNDSDNTGEKSVSFIDWIEVLGPATPP